MPDEAGQSQAEAKGVLHSTSQHVARGALELLKRSMPHWAKRLLLGLYWLSYDTRDYLAEAIGWLPSNHLRCLLWRCLGARVGRRTSVHRNCRFYRPSGVSIADHTVVNREVLLDGRMGLTIGGNVSISEGAALFTLEHDPQSPDFASRGGPVVVGSRVFIGARAIILPGNTIGEGAVVAAGAVVTHDVAPFTIVGGVPARPIGQRRTDLIYTLGYRKFLG